MARKPRVEFPGALYHVYSRGNQKQDIFLSDSDFNLFKKRLAEYKKEYNFILYAYILMRNHFHLLLEAGQVGLSKIMQGLLLSYTQYFNLKYKKVGHLFQGRYKAILCQKENYLLELIRYLHLNGVRAGLVDHPNDYKWSSHHDYLKGGSPLVDVNLALGFFAENKRVAIEKYNSFINDGVGAGTDRFYAVVDQRFLGSEAFIKDISEQLGEPVDNVRVLACDWSDIWSAVEKVFGLKKADIVKRSRDSVALHARAAFVCLCKKVGNKRGLEIAGEIGRDPAIVTNLSKLGGAQLKGEIDKAFLYLNSKLKPDPRC